jgi:hypothetical protein
LKKRLIWALILCLLPRLVYGQDLMLDEDKFWTLMRQTDNLLQQALVQPDPSAIKAEALQLWQGVRQVRLSNSVIEIDVQWVMQPLATGDSESLRTLQQRVRALLDYHASLVPGESGPALSALDEVLRDSRFRYEDVTPTPIPTQMPAIDLDPVANAVSPGLSQVLLMAAGVVAVIAVFLYFARGLHIQPAALDEIASPDEPATSSGAVDRAADFAAARDYRSAIRYLYLSSLLLLDERGLIHYDSTLTNREHLRQVHGRPQLHDLLRGIVNVFEDVWYGYAAVDETLYQQYLQHIHQLWQFVP